MILLSNRSLIKISGVDAAKFLQGLITNDIEKLTAENAVYAAILTPQGKYLFDFLIYEINGDIVIDVFAPQAESLVNRLKLYKLRSKVEIAPLSGFKVYYNLEQGISDPRTPKLGRRYITDEDEPETGSLEEYELMRLQIGVPDNGDLVPENDFIMQNNFEELHGVDFKKGCYVGQEIVARMKYKGTTRKSLFRVSGEGVLPPHGTVIKSGDKKIGQMLTSLGHYGLANCEIDIDSTKLYTSEDTMLRLKPLDL